MKNLLQINRLIQVLSGVGFTISLFFCGYALGLQQMEKFMADYCEKLTIFDFSGGTGINSYYQLSTRIFLVLICLFIIILLTLINKTILPKLISFLFTLMLLLQSYFLLSINITVLSGWQNGEIKSLVYFIYFQILIALVAILLFVLHIFSIWNSARITKDLKTY